MSSTSGSMSRRRFDGLRRWGALCGLVGLAAGCSLVRGVGRGTVWMGKAVGTTARTSVLLGGKILGTTGRVVKTIVEIPGGTRVVRLRRSGSGLFVDALIDRRASARLLVDTGAFRTQISARLAERAGIDWRRGRTVRCRLAGGRTALGRAVVLRELRVGRVRVRGVPAIVLAGSTAGYDGLLGMSFFEHFSSFKIDAARGEMTLSR